MRETSRPMQEIPWLTQPSSLWHWSQKNNMADFRKWFEKMRSHTCRETQCCEENKCRTKDSFWGDFQEGFLKKIFYGKIFQGRFFQKRFTGKCFLERLFHKIDRKFKSMFHVKHWSWNIKSILFLFTLKRGCDRMIKAKPVFINAAPYQLYWQFDQWSFLMSGLWCQPCIAL